MIVISCIPGSILCGHLLLLLMFVPYAPARKRTKNMSIEMMQVEGCDALFFVEQEPTPFLTNI